MEGRGRMTTKINGFEIEKFNQYELIENCKTSTCPICSKDRKPHNQKEKCLMVDWERGLGTCQHCGEVIQLHTFKSKKSKETKIYKKPEWHNKTNLNENIVKWFENRKISQFVLKLMKVSEGVEWMPQYKKNVHTIQFNYFLEKNLINIKFRTKNKDFKLVSDAEKIFYNLDNIKLSKDCIIVEGEIDCLSYIESGLLQTVSTPNGSTLKGVNLDYLDNYFDYFENKDKIYLALDNDEAGQNVTKELIRRLGAEKCYLVDYKDCKDANEYLIKYGKEALRQTIDNAKIVPLENNLTYNDCKNELYEYYLNGAKKGFTIGLPNFDNIFSTYTKQYIVITGVPTHGKSDFVDQMVIGYSINYNWKGVFCSPENEPKYLHIDKLCRKIAGFIPKNEFDLKGESWLITETHVNDYFNFIHYEDGYNLKKVLLKVKELVQRKGIKYFVLDPYNKIRLKESLSKNVNEYTNDYLIEVEDFCRKNDLLCILVAHPTKQNNKFDKDKSIDMYDIKGGGEFYDMAHHGLLVERNFEREYVKIKVLKCKFQNLGTNGAECFFKWNIKNGRYTPIINDVNQLDEPIKFEFTYNNLLIKEIYNNNSGIKSNKDFGDYEPIPDEDIPF